MGMLEDYEPGERIKDAVNRGNDSLDVDAVVGSRGFDIFEIPSNPGPNVMGRNPVVGSLRRKKDLPVIRDEINKRLDR